MQSNFRSLLTVVSMSLCAASFTACAHEGKTVGGIKSPESAVTGKDGKVYVSEIGEFDKDGDGQIKVIDKNGTVSVFATGMDDPKGLGLYGNTLFVADKTRVLKVNPDGKWDVLAAADAFPHKPQFLNDIAVDNLGNVYVSDSGDLKGKGGAIYRVSKSGKVTTVVDSSNPLVLGPNGLLVGGRGDLLEVDFVSGTLYSINLKSGQMTKLGEGFGAADGLVRGRKGEYYVSDWKGGRVFKMEKGGEVKLLKEGYKAAADISLSQDGRYLLVPDMKAGELVWLPIH